MGICQRTMGDHMRDSFIYNALELDREGEVVGFCVRGTRGL